MIDISYHLTQQEVTNMISQIVISRSDWGGRRKALQAFIEHSVAMISST